MHLNDVKFSTTNIVPGYDILEYRQVVFERVVAGVGIVTEFFAGLSDTFGGRSGRMEAQMDKLYEELLSAVAASAQKVDANAVIGFSIDINEISGKGTSMLMISGTGTAVHIKPHSGATLDKPMRKKEAPWHCVGCKTVNASEMTYCPNCGEIRHFDWKCGKCGQDNGALNNFCSHCGTARMRDYEKIIDYTQPSLQKFDLDDLLDTLNAMSTATEIYQYLSKTFSDSSNEDFVFFMKKLEVTKIIEESFGNQKKDAYALSKAFFVNGARVFVVSDAAPLVCPVCGLEQKPDRSVCFKCGALFRKEEKP